MSSECISDIQITDEDIKWAEAILGKDIHFNEEHIKVIKCSESKDVQAFPGSGKTTALVAKLAILAKKWPASFQGICVLSHTNAAREEIEKRLGATEVGRKILSYPHFVGTFQSFFDTYVASPWLRSKGYQIIVVDDDIVFKNRWFSLPNGTRTFLENRHLGSKFCGFNKKLNYIKLPNSKKEIEVSTEKIIKERIFESQKKGYFTFHEMLLFAEEALDNCNEIPISLQRRFPIVLIDEAQDTLSFHWKLIEKAFPTNGSTIIQCFGDKNQAIFSEGAKQQGLEVFPRENYLIMSKSNRFNDIIAKLANTVALDYEEMQGNSNVFADKNIKHTIFLFAKKSIDKVLPAYGKLLLDTFTDEELENYGGCYAVGQTLNSNDTDEQQLDINNKKYPQIVRCYWPNFISSSSVSNKVPKKFIGYFVKGFNDFQATGEMGLFIAEIFSGIKRLLNLVDNEHAIKLKGNKFSSSIIELTCENQELIRNALKALVTGDIVSKDNWCEKQKCIVKIAKGYGLNVRNLHESERSRLNDFVSWDDSINISATPDEKLINDDSIYTHVDEMSNRCVAIRIGSIHSVKGQTHLATLVLETFFHEHNMQSILPYLCKMAGKKKGEWIKKRLKCQYVAMTRARGLVCLAMPIENVNAEQREALEKLGWKIKIIK